MRLTILIFEADGRGTRSLHTSVRALCGSLLIVLASLGGVAWLGWKLGELTEHL
jgi:hypothetical protein